jgi:hypothetical protein
MPRLSCYLVAAVALVFAGCGKKGPPPVVEARGVVLLDGKPLPNASVQFLPMLKDFGAEFNSTAITDDEGKFTLMCMNNKSGAVTAKHKVVVTEYTPAEGRGESGEAQTRLAQFRAKLKNRPIPENYTDALHTPLEVEISADKQDYTLELKRR